MSVNAHDAVLVVEPEFGKLLAERRAKAQRANSSDSAESSTSAESPSHAASVQNDGEDESVEPGLQLIANLARDRSQLAVRRIQTVLRNWQQHWVSQELSAAGINPQLVQPIALKQNDTSETSLRRSMLWAKILPFIMLVWALTGAFYPAIDLCAGEKERGTLETLLSSPARRREIVWGKLFTVVTFSIMSALLNLLSMQLTTGFIVEHWLRRGHRSWPKRLALAYSGGRLAGRTAGTDVSVFQRLALAVAALARSTKEANTT